MNKWGMPKALFVAALAGSLAGGPPLKLVSASPRETKLLPVPQKLQSTLAWCWAASIAMVVEYYHATPTRDCEVLSTYDRSLGGRGMCCFGAAECMRGALPWEIGPILGGLFNLPGRTIERALTWPELVENIRNGRPVVAWIWNSPQTAHVVVLYGFTETPDRRTVHVLDPLRGAIDVNFDGFAANWGPQHNWNISWVFSKSGRGGDRESHGASRECTQPCSHPAHSAGDPQACIHPAHQFDQIPCQHCVPGWTGVQCLHPFDMVPCSHPSHPYDLVPCSHPAHPAGDPVACR